MSFTVIARFKANQLPKTGVTTATIDIVRISDGALVVNDGAVSEIGTATGVYTYVFAAYDATELYSFDITTNDVTTDSPTYGGDTANDTKEALTDIDDNLFDPATDAVANVTLVATTTTNTDMRGTDGANTVVPDNATITAIDAKTTNLPADPAATSDITALNDFDPATDTVANVTLVATTTTNTDMRGTDGANTVVPDNNRDVTTVNGIAVSGPDDLKADVSLLATAASVTALTSITEIIRKIQFNRVVVSGDQQNVDVYEDNGTTIAFSFGVSLDGLERNPL